MQAEWFYIAMLLAVLGLTSCGANQSTASPPSNTPAEVREWLSGADRLELLSLNPKEQSGTFHEYEIIGSLEIKDVQQRQQAVDAYYQSMRDSDGMVAKCFYPRHGFRAVRGSASLDVLICFQCMQSEVYRSGQTTRSKTFPITKDSKNILTRMLKDAKIRVEPSDDEPKK